jgi:hypothetical protein
MRVPRSLFSLALLFALGCEEDDNTVTLPCDVRTRACQRAVFSFTKRARGQDDATMPPIRVITRVQLEEELRAGLAQENEGVDEEKKTRDTQDQLAMSLLGFLPPPAEKSSDEAYVQQSVQNIGAYYSTATQDITVIADQVNDERSGTVTLSHELLHALQDQREGLNKWREPLISSSDSYMATKALTEGEATWLSYVTYYDGVYGTAPEGIDRTKILGEMLTRTLGYLEKESDAPLISAQQLMPYPLGAEFIARVHINKGLDQLAALYEAPLRSLRSFPLPEVTDLPESLDCELPPPPAGYEQLSTDKVGLAGLLAYHVGRATLGRASYDAALDWRADQLSVFAIPGQPEEVAIAWRVRLGSESDAMALANQSSAQLGMVATRFGRETLIAAARSTEVLQSWQPLEAPCVSPNKGRGSADRARRSRDDVLGIVR